jgi:hypothetical protein
MLGIDISIFGSRACSFYFSFKDTKCRFIVQIGVELLGSSILPSQAPPCPHPTPSNDVRY